VHPPNRGEFDGKKTSIHLKLTTLLREKAFMDDEFKIYIEQLRDGRERDIDEKLSPSFLEIADSDLSFEKDVKVKGVAYLAEDDLIINWTIEAEALIACSICNEKVPVPVSIQNAYYNESLDNIKSGIFNFKDILRETILLEVPPFAECNEGNCPKRQEIKKYLKQPSSNNPDQDEGYQPFADLDLK
jgi:uncharacterized metal-binding protein YceD (DUF177 family)